MALLRPEAYPHAVRAITLVETHLSWVLLTGEFAYKIKRPVRFAFVDLSTYERRAYFCAEELRLNRRFAPELYLEVCDIRESDGLAHIGGKGRVIERCVRMRQFPERQELDKLLADNRIAPEALAEFGRDLADIHARLPVAGVEQRWGRPALIRSVILENLDEYVRAAAALDVDHTGWALRAALEARLDAATACMAERRRTGRVRECHGDLHTRNIVQREGRLIPFDCIEFEPAFRWIDVAEELALLLADLEARGRPRHAYAFLSGYLARSGDYAACRLLDMYKAHRSLVRAKVAALEVTSASDERIAKHARAEHDAHLRGARSDLAAKRPRLILVSGFSGSGKTWLAQQIAPELGAIHIRSDVERKRAAGIAEHASSESATGAGLYTRENTAQVYEHLAQCANDILSGGYSAIVDATFLTRAQRARFQQLARQLDVPLQVIQCDAPENVLRERVMNRKSAGKDASEADLAVLDWQLQNHERISSDELLDVAYVETNRADAVTQALSVLEKA